jgi:nucleotide-binding universal stress UspA family protein
MEGSSAGQSVVIATDGSESADRAVAAGATVARSLGGRAVLVYVRPSLGTLGAPYYQEKLSEQMAHARAALDGAHEIMGDQGIGRRRRSWRGRPPSRSSSLLARVMPH